VRSSLPCQDKSLLFSSENCHVPFHIPFCVRWRLVVQYTSRLLPLLGSEPIVLFSFFLASGNDTFYVWCVSSAIPHSFNFYAYTQPTSLPRDIAFYSSPVGGFSGGRLHCTSSSPPGYSLLLLCRKKTRIERSVVCRFQASSLPLTRGAVSPSRDRSSFFLKAVRRWFVSPCLKMNAAPLSAVRYVRL